MLLPDVLPFDEFLGDSALQDFAEDLQELLGLFLAHVVSLLENGIRSPSRESLGQLESWKRNVEERHQCSIDASWHLL